MDYRDYSWRDLIAECWAARPVLVLGAPFTLLMVGALFAASLGFGSDFIGKAVLIGAGGSVVALAVDRWTRVMGRDRSGE